METVLDLLPLGNRKEEQFGDRPVLEVSRKRLKHDLPLIGVGDPPAQRFLPEMRQGRHITGTAGY